MKRCPQCEFIYEDDQSLCDMDGVLLVLDSRNLPNLHALAPVPGVAPKTHKRNRAVPAFATLILVIVLGAVYFVTTQRKTATFTPDTTTSTTVPAANPEPPIQPAAAIEPPAATETPSPEKEETKPAASKPVTVAKKATTKPTSTTQTKASTAEKKKDENKVGSILKKTGRILKKPFKF